VDRVPDKFDIFTFSSPSGQETSRYSKPLFKAKKMDKFIQTERNADYNKRLLNAFDKGEE